MAVDTLVTGSKLTAIADAIRTVCDTDSTYTLDEMPNAIIKGGGGGSSFDWSNVYSLRNFLTGYQGTTLDLSMIQATNNAELYSFLSGARNLTTITGLSGLNIKAAGGVDIGSIFYNCQRLTSVDFTGATWTTSSQYASFSCYQSFYYCYALTSVVLPTVNIRSANLQSTFYYCNELEEVDLRFLVGDSSSVGECTLNSTFADCTKLKRIYLPTNYTFNFRGGISYCDNLEAVIITDTTFRAATNNTLFAGATPPANCFIYVPDALVNDYKTATNWSVYTDIIKPLSEMPA